MTPTTRKPWIVFGEALVDHFPDVQITGGAPFNAARNLAGLGEDVRFVTSLGKDATGRLIRDEMQDRGMSLALVQQSQDYPTGTVRVDQAADGSHEFHILSNQAYDHIDADTLLSTVSQWQQPLQVYHGTLCLRSAASRRAWKALCGLTPSPRFVDMNWREGHLTQEAALAALQGADVLKLSDEELALVLRWQCASSEFAATPAREGLHCAALEKMMSQLAVKTLVVTYGAQGSAAYQAGLCIAQADAVKLDKFVDTVGAGDSFSAVCMLALSQQWGWQTALPRANAFAAAICGVRGAVPDNMAFYKRWRLDWGL